MSKDFGPFPFVQLTYEILRVGPEGDDFAWFDPEEGAWFCKETGDEWWSDVVIWGKEE